MGGNYQPVNRKFIEALKKVKNQFSIYVTISKSLTMMTFGPSALEEVVGPAIKKLEKKNKKGKTKDVFVKLYYSPIAKSIGFEFTLSEGPDTYKLAWSGTSGNKKMNAVSCGAFLKAIKIPPGKYSINMGGRAPYPTISFKKRLTSPDGPAIALS